MEILDVRLCSAPNVMSLIMAFISQLYVVSRLESRLVIFIDEHGPFPLVVHSRS